jgi:hypothetical protein
VREGPPRGLARILFRIAPGVSAKRVSACGGRHRGQLGDFSHVGYFFDEVLSCWDGEVQ